MVRWNKADIPHKGWRYIGIEDLGEDVYPLNPPAVVSEHLSKRIGVQCKDYGDTINLYIFLLPDVVYYYRVP